MIRVILIFKILEINDNNIIEISESKKFIKKSKKSKN